MNLTVVTGIWDINRAEAGEGFKRPFDHYINNFNKLLSKETEECKNNKVCSIDPGVRNFVSLYSDNKIANIGINCNEKINKLNIY